MSDARKYKHSTHEPCKPEPRDDQILMQDMNGFEFHADSDMVPLLRALNMSGIQTYSHCAGHVENSVAWVVVEIDNLNVEFRQKDNRTQMILTINAPPWGKQQRKEGANGTT